MFINLSNHKSSLWSESQRYAAQEWGEIVDYPFPNVEASGDEEYIAQLADRIAADIINLHPTAVMCQGEFSLTYALVVRLKNSGIIVLTACSRRIAEEATVDGHYEKKVSFVFERFRKY